MENDFYCRLSNENDIALLELRQHLTFTSTVSPICIPPNTPEFDLPSGTSCIATGWGRLSKCTFDVKLNCHPGLLTSIAKVLLLNCCLFQTTDKV